MNKKEAKELDLHIQEKIDQAEGNADSLWLIKAEEYTSFLATKKRMFTSEDVIVWLDDHGYHTGNLSALGGVFRRLKEQGAIAPAGYTTSRRASRHYAPIRMWKSLIYEGETL